jgi:RimJ/RimL family protein N-acetyltransferase
MLAETEQRAEKCRQALIDPGDYEFFCAVIDGKIIGRLIISKSRDEDKSDAGEIAAIYLMKAFWGNGYGREMMDFAVNSLKRMGHSEAFLWVFEENVRARRFYEKYGFVFDGTKKEFELGKPLVELRYVFDL